MSLPTVIPLENWPSILFTLVQGFSPQTNIMCQISPTTHIGTTHKEDAGGEHHNNGDNAAVLSSTPT